MALSVVYFQFMHRLGRPHYVWDKYLYSVLEEVEVRMTMCNCFCSVIVLYGMMMKGREKVKPSACSSRKALRGLPSLTPPSDGRIAINSTTGYAFSTYILWEGLCSVIVLWSVRWLWRVGRRWNVVLAHSLLFLKSTKGATRLNVAIRRMNHYQQYYMPSRQIYCRRIWNLLQACDVHLAIRSCTSPPLLAPRLKFSNENLLPRRGSNPGPTEPEADMLPSEPAWRWAWCLQWAS